MRNRRIRSTCLAVAMVGLLGLGGWRLAQRGTESRTEALGAEELSTVARFDKPFPQCWMHWLFDEELVRKSRESGGGHSTARSPGDLQLGLTLWPGPEVTAGEVVIARFGVTNPAETQAMFPFIGSLGEAIHFEVTEAQGRPRGRVYSPPPSRADGFVESFPPGCTKQYETVVNHWFDFADPGEYAVEARLVVVDRSHSEEEPVVLSSQKTALTVLPREAVQLARRCEQLYLAQRLGGAKQTPVEPAPGSGYRPSEEACRQALLHLTDEVALPYLQLMLGDYPSYPDAVSAISCVDSPKVPALLQQLAARGTEAVRARAKESLARLGVAGGGTTQTNPPAKPPADPRKQALAKAPAMKVSALIERLCQRDGLALVAAPEVAETDAQVRVGPEAPICEVAAALNAAGLRAFDSAGGHALVSLGPPAAEPELRDSERHQLAYRLLRTVTPAQLEQQGKGAFKGYIESQHLTKGQIATAYMLLGYPAGGNRPRPPLSKLALGLWRISGASGIRSADGESLVVHVGNAAPPAELLSAPLGGSVLWWYWPHALSDQLSADLVSVAPAQTSLQAVAKRATPAGQIAIDDLAVSAAAAPLFVAARSAPIGHFVWALEIATGLQAKAPGEDDLPQWRFVTDRYPTRADRTDTLLRLPALGCGSPAEAPAAKALLARFDEPLTPAVAYNMRGSLARSTLLSREDHEMRRARHTATLLLGWLAATGAAQPQPGPDPRREAADKLAHYALFDEAAEAYADLLKTDPNDFGARLALAEVYYRGGSFDAAEKECQTIARAGDDAQKALAQACLGDVYRKQGKRDEARQAYGAAKALVGGKTALEYQEAAARVQRGLGFLDWEKAESQKTIVSFPADSPAKNSAAGTARFLDSRVAAIEKLSGKPFAGKLEVYYLSTPDQWKRLLGDREWPNAQEKTEYVVVGRTFFNLMRTLSFYLGNEDMKDLPKSTFLAHGFAAAYCGSRTWGRRILQQTSEMKKANQLPPLGELLKSTASGNATSALGASFVWFVVNAYGEAKFVAFWKAFNDDENALTAIYGKSVDEQSRWRYYWSYQYDRGDRQLLDQEEVWHTLRLTNAGGIPWTTAPALTVQNGRPLGQDVLFYTSPGAKTLLKITRAVDVKAEQGETEVERQRAARTGYGGDWDLITVKGELRLFNYKAKAITVLIKKTLSGELLDTSPKPDVETSAQGVWRVNPKQVLTWELPVEASGKGYVSYRYKVHARR